MVRTPLLPIGAAVTLRRTLLAIVAALAVAVAVPRADAGPGSAAPSTRAFAPADQVTVAFRFRRVAAGPVRPVAFRLNGRSPAIGSRLGADGRWHTVRARLDTAQGWIRVAVDGRPTGARRLAATRPEVGVRIGGPREGSGIVVEDVRVEANDAELQTGRPAAPLEGARLFVDPGSAAGAQAAAWRATRPADAALLDRIAAQPQADWIGDWSGDVKAAAAGRIAAARAAAAVPVLVAYDIPDRDCDQHSGGGAPDGASYRAWIDRFAAGIGDARAVVVLEPDALAGLDCLDDAGQRERLGLLAGAVSRLAAQPGAVVYLDAGNPAWRSAPEMARRLAAAGVSEARGFSLNVSNFRTTAENRAYGRAISRLVGDKPFVIDTSRNGAGPSADGAWCNPPDRALGQEPTTDTGDPLVDAYLWIKRPGESDGTCQGGPRAGTWWPEYALGLARRAASPELA